MASDSFRELAVFKKAFSPAMEIFDLSKTFRQEERYSLTDQKRRSSRAGCSHMAEAYQSSSDLENKAIEVGKLLNHKIQNPKKYLTAKQKLSIA